MHSLKIAICSTFVWGAPAVSWSQSFAPTPEPKVPVGGAEVSEKPAAAAPPAEAKPKNYSVRSKAYGARLETDPPGYAKPLSERKGLGLDEVDWLDFGLEHRTRFEYREDDLRRADRVRDEQFLLRSRAYIGVRKILDPFRFTLEFEDARQFLSEFPESDREIDENDFIQVYGELYFDDVFGKGQPFRLAAGRMTLDLVDRKLVGRPRWRNTTNAFDGFRMQLGSQSGPWQIDAFATQVVQRRLRQPDHPDEERFFYGVVGAWRERSVYVTIEPYYFVLDEDRKGRALVDREIHTLGLHVYGPIEDTPFDYDTDAAFQFGDDGARDQRAFATYGEIGYTWDHKWKPRLSVSGTYASGDQNPNDNVSERFERLFAPNHYRSTSDYLTWQNIISPKLRVELQPTKEFRIDAAYGGYWLASDSDTFGGTTRRDRNGDGGNFAGQETEVRARYQLLENAELELGYSYFFDGDFISNTGPADDSEFFYVQMTVGF